MNVPILSAPYVAYADPDDPTADAPPPRKFEQPEPPHKIGAEQPDYQNSETVERVRRERHGGGIRPAALLPLPATSPPVALPDYQNQETMDRVAREALLASGGGGGGGGNPSPSGTMGGVVRLEDGAWYFGGMDRDTCDELVLNGGEGAFVVRDSSSRRGYVLMVNENGETVNYSVGRGRSAPHTTTTTTTKTTTTAKTAITTTTTTTTVSSRSCPSHFTLHHLYLVRLLNTAVSRAWLGLVGAPYHTQPPAMRSRSLGRPTPRWRWWWPRPVSDCSKASRAA